MKRIAVMWVAIIMLILNIPAGADVIFLPEDRPFYEAHTRECENLSRNFYANGKKGYIALCDQPGGKAESYLKNGSEVHIQYTYTLNQAQWGMATYLNGENASAEVWIKMDELYLIYDERSFREDHGKEIKAEEGKVEGTEKIYYYNYPGAKRYGTYTPQEGEAFPYSEQYTDPLGKRWGYAGYYRGLQGCWVCIDAPASLQKPFGGDPKLEEIEAQGDTALPQTPEDEKGAEKQEEQELIPPKDPPLLSDPYLWISGGLVAAAVILSVILLFLCYRKRN